MSWDFNQWDLSGLSSDEQAAFWSSVRKSGNEPQTTDEMAAYNKAVQLNVPDAASGHGKAGFGQEAKDFQRQAYMYSYVDPDAQKADWAKRKLDNGGFWDEANNWVAGTWEGGLFYPSDTQAPCLGAPAGAVDRDGAQVPPG
jgi:hypothetical protein